jgi:heavy metal sensor kinase
VRTSIRFRLTIWYSLALASGLLLFGLATWLFMWQSLQADVERTLQAQMQHLELFLNAEIAVQKQNLAEELDEYSQAFPAGMSVSVTDGARRPIFNSNSSFPWQRIGNTQRMHWRHRNYSVLKGDLRVQKQHWRAVLVMSLEDMEKTLRLLRILLLASIPAVTILATLGGAWLSRHALRPVDAITAAARSIEIGNLSARLEVASTGDELQRLSETLNSMLARLEDAVTRLSRFTADASHELRTPLAVIRATAEIASRMTRPADSYRATLRQIVAEADRMTSLIEDLLFLARCDAQHPDLVMSDVGLRKLVCDLCLELQVLAETKGIQVRYEVGDYSPHVLGNEAAIRRLILALLDNAIKYSAPGGRVAVRLYCSEQEARLEVADAGPGIPEAEVSRIFERFYRTPQAHESGSNGYGLGLSLANSIARHHHARLTVVSRPGEGCTFTVSFPEVSSPRDKPVAVTV